MTPQERIYAAFPADDKQPHRAIRFSLLRIVHAANNAETALYLTADFIDSMIDNPPWSLWCGPDEPRELAERLRALASEIDKACTALDAARPFWTSLTDSLTEKEAASHVVNHGPDREQPAVPVLQDGEATPF